MAEKWVQGAINKEHSGDLRAFFGIKEGDTIPQERLNALIKRLEAINNKTPKEDHLLKMAVLARTMKHF